MTDAEIIARAIRDDDGNLAGPCNTCAHAVRSRCNEPRAAAWVDRFVRIVEICGIGVLHVVRDSRGFWPCNYRVPVKRAAR